MLPLRPATLNFHLLGACSHGPQVMLEYAQLKEEKEKCYKNPHLRSSHGQLEAEMRLARLAKWLIAPAPALGPGPGSGIKMSTWVGPRLNTRHDSYHYLKSPDFRVLEARLSPYKFLGHSSVVIPFISLKLLCFIPETLRTLLQLPSATIFKTLSPTAHSLLPTLVTSYLQLTFTPLIHIIRPSFLPRPH